MEILEIRHSYPERGNFTLKRPNGRNDFTFLHFYNCVELLISGEIVVTQPHSFIIYDKKTPQYFYSSEPLLHDWFHFIGENESFLKYGIEPDTLYTLSSHEFVTDIIRELESDFCSQRRFSGELMRHKLCELFIRLSRDINGEREILVNRETKEKVRLLRSKVFLTPYKNWSVANMAAELNFSESYFYNLYKSLYGISPKSDIINAKINTAKNMLTQGESRVDEIALKLGYNNTSHFIRQFKQFTGASPLNYRKIKRK